jgi:hypothetical protein
MTLTPDEYREMVDHLPLMTGWLREVREACLEAESEQPKSPSTVRRQVRANRCGVARVLPHRTWPRGKHRSTKGRSLRGSSASTNTK